jgi:hypothetical protein
MDFAKANTSWFPSNQTSIFVHHLSNLLYDPSNSPGSGMILARFLELAENGFGVLLRRAAVLGESPWSGGPLVQSVVRFLSALMGFCQLSEKVSLVVLHFLKLGVEQCESSVGGAF